MNSTLLRKMILTLGLFLVGISLYCSFLLYTSFSPNLSDKAAWGGMGLGLDAFKNVALLAAFALWGLGLFAARVLALVVTAAYGLLTVLSFSAFFGFMAGVQHRLEQTNLHAGTRYRSLQASLEQATRQVASLSRYADAAQVEQAQQRLREHQARLTEVRRGMARYAHADCSPKHDRRGQPYTTRAAEWCAELRAAETEAAPWRATVQGHRDYQAALVHRRHVLDELSTLDSGEVAVADGQLHPMFADLGKLFAKAPEETKVGFMFVSSASAEVLGSLSIVIASLLGRRRSFTVDEIEHLAQQLHGQQVRLQQALNLDAAALPQSETVPRLSEQSWQAEFGTPGAARFSGETEAVFDKSPPAPSFDTSEPLRAGFYERGENSAGESPRLRIPPVLGVEHVYTEMRRAILNGACPPKETDLMQRYRVPRHTAAACLRELAAQGQLDTTARRGVYRLRGNAGGLASGSLCDAVECEREGRNVQIYFSVDDAALPVRLRNGEVEWLPWGKRSHETPRLPTGGWARLEAVRAGQWQNYRPRPVQIPARGYLEKNLSGHTQWFELGPDTALQGLLAEQGEEQRVYLITVPEAPPQVSHEFGRMHDRWPRLVQV